MGSMSEQVYHSDILNSFFHTQRMFLKESTPLPLLVFLPNPFFQLFLIRSRKFSFPRVRLACFPIL